MSGESSFLPEGRKRPRGKEGRKRTYVMFMNEKRGKKRERKRDHEYHYSES